MRPLRSALITATLLIVADLANARLEAQNNRPAPFAVPAWAFPLSNAVPPAPDSVTLEHVPNSSRAFTRKQVGNGFDVVDWFPSQHPPMPAAVQYGQRPDGRACALCHLPDGQGRPENATLAGLPVEYIVRQVRAFKNETRLSATPDTPLGPMHRVAKGFSRDEDVREAARYYSKLQLTHRNVVREVRDVPRTRLAGLLYAYDGDGTEPIDGRLIEVPESIERHELKDPWVTYVG